jgi:phenylpropionate dioxygenase-like ring-hydroxylating dioxygenase large terminal subunit
MEARAATDLAPGVPSGLEVGIRNYWYPILIAEELKPDKPVALRCLGEDLVVWRNGRGQPGVLRDRCPHRAARLSIGRILDGQLQCIFHGLRFDVEGRCALIPWEPDDSPSRQEISTKAYPVREHGGYIWAYMGEPAKFPPPPVEDETPEEMSKPDEFLIFHMPTEVWNANWLLTIDGGDGFHAVTLHAETQAVDDSDWKGGRPDQATASLAERRIKIVQTTYGVRGIAIDRSGKPVHHGHYVETKGERFVLPCLTSNVIRPVPGVEPYVARLWQFPLDEKKTIVQRTVAWRVKSQQDREHRTKLYRDVVRPRLEGIAREDALVAEAQGDLLTARSNEHLFDPDRTMYQVRQHIKNSFLAQAGGKRVANKPEALVWPVV